MSGDLPESARAGAAHPFHVHRFPRLRSTNSHAIVMRRRKALFAPAVVVTAHQLAGRGRGSNAWWSGEGSLTATFVLPVDDAIAPHQVPLLAGLAVRRACAILSGNDAIQLKWPNDLLHGGRKLAGLLCERFDGVDLIGVGLNVNVSPGDVPKGLRDRVTSLKAIAGRAMDIEELLLRIAAELRAELSLKSRAPERSFAVALREYDRYHALLGRRVSIVPPGDEPAVAGICRGLDDMGRLLVETRKGTGGIEHVIAGHVTLL